MGSTTIRISPSTYATLSTLSNETGQTIQAVLDQALDSYRRERFFAQVDKAYEALWQDPLARDGELAERALFENTLSDDLRDD